MLINRVLLVGEDAFTSSRTNDFGPCRRVDGVCTIFCYSWKYHTVVQKKARTCPVRS